MDVDRHRLQRLLGGAASRKLVAALRRRLERGGGDAVTLTGVSEDERRAAETLLGRATRRGTTLRVRLDHVEQTLRKAEVAPSLAAALEALGGPLVDRAAERAALAERWDEVFEARRAVAGALDLEGWLSGLRETGLLKRLARGEPEVADALAGEALRVLGRLPVQGLSHSALAAEVLGDAHALDRGRPVATLVRHALAMRCRLVTEVPAVADPDCGGLDPSGPDDERTLWASAGVLLGGDVTSTVLALNLPAAADTPSGRAVRALAEAGEPVYLTLRQLLRAPPTWLCAGRTVFVCENPAVVAEAATQLGPRCPPLVATSGQPRAAARTLLARLTAAGARPRVQADLDWAGLSIAGATLAHPTATPWHMNAATLRRFAKVPGRPLEGPGPTCPWDPDLAAALQERGQALEEEQMLDLLLKDLSTCPRS